MGWEGGGRYVGGLGVAGPLLVDLLALLSLSWLSNALLLIWALISSILRCVSAAPPESPLICRSGLPSY